MKYEKKYVFDIDTKEIAKKIIMDDSPTPIKEKIKNYYFNEIVMVEDDMIKRAILTTLLNEITKDVFTEILNAIFKRKEP